MADKELRKLKRRDLLKMLLVQCEETERLQQENTEMRAELTELTETFERLKEKLNVKDERLNQKDAEIEQLNRTIEEMQASKAIELEEAGNIAEAALRLNGIFEAAQRSAEQYLMNIRRLGEKAAAPADIQRALPMHEARRKPQAETGWRPGIIRKKNPPARVRRDAQLTIWQTTDAGRDERTAKPRYAAAGDMHG